MEKGTPQSVSAAETEIRRRAFKWQQRASFWRHRKVRQRLYRRLGVNLQPVLWAATALLVACKVPAAAIIAAVLGFLCSAAAAAAAVSQLVLEQERPELAWVCADRLDEAYRSLLARLADGAPASSLLAQSDLLEARARFGVPEALAEALETVSPGLFIEVPVGRA